MRTTIGLEARAEKRREAAAELNRLRLRVVTLEALCERAVAELEEHRSEYHYRGDDALLAQLQAVVRRKAVKL